MCMSDDQFTKLFKYIEAFRKDIDSRFDRVDERIGRLERAIDVYAKKAYIYFQETVALGSKIDRLEKALKEVIATTSVKVSL